MKREHLGSMTFQAQEVMKELIKFSESKHAAKETFLKNYQGSKAIDKFMSSFGKASGIYSFETFREYLRVAVSASTFAKENFGIKNIKNLTSEHINAFLQSKINENPAKSTIQKYSAALEKFETALTLKYSQKYDFKIKTTPLEGKEKLVVKERAGYHPYLNSSALVEKIKSMNIKESHKVAIELTKETGLRLHKALTAAGIKINPDKTLSTVSKGGRQKEMNVSSTLYDKVASLANDGVFKLDSKDYKAILEDLKIAARDTNQHYEALHGFRHSFFLEKTSELQEKGMNLKDSWDKVSKNDMDHNRFISAYTRG